MVICVFDRNGQRVDNENDENKKAKVFYMIRGEPMRRMTELISQFSALKCCIDERKEIVSSEMASEDLLHCVNQFDINEFHDWYPSSFAV